jgi:hypothetical protein
MRVLLAGLLLGAWLGSVQPGVLRADELSAGVAVRADTDHTVVVSPRAHLSTEIAEDTRAAVTYTADVWTSASVDVRASASRPVTEQRDELDFGLSHDFGDLTLSGGYRYSIENDYVSHGALASAALALAQNNANIAVHAHARDDTVGRSGEPTFARNLVSGGAQLIFSQALSRALLGQASYELDHFAGYQASPYRYVGIGGTGFGCVGASMCLPEHEPDQRTRQALSLNLRIALAAHWSAAANYRIYRDDWGLWSHGLRAQATWSISELSMLSLHYRFYIQNGVNFYRAIYDAPSDRTGYTTRDRALSPMNDQELGLDWEQRVPIDSSGTQFSARVSLGAVAYHYRSFVGLNEVEALELSIALGLTN